MGAHEQRRSLQEVTQILEEMERWGQRCPGPAHANCLRRAAASGGGLSAP